MRNETSLPTKEWTKQEIDALIQILETEGIVTGKDNSTLNSIVSRSIRGVFERLGYTNFIYFEEALNHHFDYAGAVYNTDYYSDQEAREYMRKYILKTY